MNLKLKKTVLAMAAAGIGLGMAATADAGRIVLTGHDNDFHISGGAVAATTAELTYVRAGSALPVLVIDAGSEASSLVDVVLGAGNRVTIAPAAITAADFDPTLYSAFLVASEEHCGGCDNPHGTGTLLASFSTAINAFFNAGRGILGETAADDAAGFAYVPQAAGTPTPIFDTSGFVSTGLFPVAGFTAVNGDQTHNIFDEPGTGGVSAVYQVAERFERTGAPVTIFAEGTIVCPPGTPGCVIVGTTPEPGTMSLLGLAMAGFGAMFRRRSKK